MRDIPQEVLDRYPRLKSLMEEVAGFEAQLGQAEANIQGLRGELESARAVDLDAAAKALRAGKSPPKKTKEDAVQAQLDNAEREARVLRRAHEAAQSDLAQLRAKYQGELYADVLEVRSAIAAEIAEHAQGALASFSRWSDLFYVVKDLVPPEPAPEQPDRPASLSNHFIGAAAVLTTQPAGPERGTIEQVLQHLVSLAPHQARSTTDAA